MRLPFDLWQGHANHWQSAFIGENLLPLGHAAWQGYLTHGRGMVACEIEVVEAINSDWSGDVMQYSVQYLAATAIAPYLQTYPLSADFISRLMATVREYSPDREILISLRGNGQMEVNWWQNLAIAPPECYRQVCNRWTEFALG